MRFEGGKKKTRKTRLLYQTNCNGPQELSAVEKRKALIWF